MNTLKKTFLLAALAVPTLAIAGAGPADLTVEPIFVEEISVVPLETLDSEMGAKPEKLFTRSRLAVPSSEPADRTMTLYASDKTAEVKYEKIGSVFGLDNSRFNLAFLFNEERDNAISGTIMYDVKPVFLKGLKVSFGPKMYAGLLSIENADVFAFGVATELSYQFPFRMFPLQLQGSINYAPDILTFGQIAP